MTETAAGTRRQRQQTAQAAKMRRLAPWIGLGTFAVFSFTLTGTDSSWAHLAAVVLSTGLLGWVLWVSIRALDQRRSGLTPLLAAVPVWALPPFLLVATYNQVLGSETQMRLMFLLSWSTAGLVVWVAFDRYRRRQEWGTSDRAAVAAALIGVAVALIPQLVSIASVGRPVTEIVPTMYQCVGGTPSIVDGRIAQLVTTNGMTFTAASAGGAWSFEGVRTTLSSL